MVTAPKPETSHPFGGCNRLLNDYRTLGRELLCYERGNRLYGYRSFTAFSAFREGVAFVPVEVLESYLEDLLDLDIGEDRLFIQREGRSLRMPAICLFGLAAALAVGLGAAKTGASEMISLAIAVLLAVPFALLWHFYPKTAVTRRVLFARVLSQEIARRRGRDKDGQVGAGFVFERLLSKKGAGSMQGAAREIVH